VTDFVGASVQVPNRLGLHARAAAKLVGLANRYQAHVEVSKDGKTADAKSIMGVLLLCGQQGCELSFRARGEDAEAAIAALSELVRSGFGEES
jgi:phosphocarrier protein